MNYIEVKGDLFSEDILGGGYALCHCISSDFALGAGIAVKFAEMGVKEQLRKTYPREWSGRGYCLMTETNGVIVGNLVTKRSSYMKPTLVTLRQALEEIRDKTADMGIDKIAMPKIGCGLDRLKWENVSLVIREVFENTCCEIMVRYL